MENFTERELSYFNALNEMRMAIKYNKKASMSGICKEYKISTSVTNALKNAGIIINNGGHARKTSWEWISIAPNMKMVKSIILDTNSLEATYSQSKRDSRKVIKNKNMDMPQLIKSAPKQGREIISTPKIKVELTYFLGIKIIRKTTEYLIK